MTADGTDNARDVATQSEGAEIHPTYTGRTLVLRGRLEVAVAASRTPPSEVGVREFVSLIQELQAGVLSHAQLERA